MATSNYTTKRHGSNTIKITWTAIPNGNIGKGRKVSNYPDKTVTIDGTFGTGGSCTMQGSNDSTTGVDGNWYPLADPQGNAITKTAAAIEAILENPVWVRPTITAGDGTTAINVILACHRNT